MIKDITQACITTIINGYEREINRAHIQIYTRMALKEVIGDLGDFLDYIADLKEDVQPTNTEAERSYYDQIETKDYQITMLKNENLKLTKRVDELCGQTVELVDKIEPKNQLINKLKCSDRMWNEIYRQNLERIKKLTGI